MRLMWKLTLVVALGAVTQALISRYADEIDEAGFAANVYLAHVRGKPMEHPDLLNLAVELRNRQWARREAPTQPVRRMNASVPAP